MLNIKGMSKIGMTRGGQLGKMFLQELLNYGFETYVLDSDPDAPCKSICNEFTLGDPNNFNDLYLFGKKVDILVIEFEDVCVEALQKLEDEGLKIYPSPSILKIVQDKGLQKQFYKNNNLPTADFIFIENRSELQKHLNFFPAIQKSRRAGYDGKGIHTLMDEKDIAAGFDQPSILEKKVDFEKEISVIVARNMSGEIVHYPVIEMEFHPHKNLVELLFAPARINQKTTEKAVALAREVATKLNIIGLLAVEMFVLKNDEILINEISPRLHNSGHHTIEANITSQFDQCIRSILNFPLGKADAFMPSAMINILGEEGYNGEAKYVGIDTVLTMEKTYVHLYGKKYTKPYRKMGHVTVLGDTIESVLEKAYAIKNTLKVIS